MVFIHSVTSDHYFDLPASIYLLLRVQFKHTSSFFLSPHSIQMYVLHFYIYVTLIISSHCPFVIVPICLLFRVLYLLRNLNTYNANSQMVTLSRKIWYRQILNRKPDQTFDILHFVGKTRGHNSNMGVDVED